MDLKTRVEQVLSEILSEKYECKVTLRFVPREAGKDREHEEIIHTESQGAA